MLDQFQTFPCANCKQIISDRAEACRHCGVPVDRGIALILADTQSKVNQACSDASHLKTAAFAMWVFFLVSLVPFVPLATWCFLVTFVAVIVMYVRWQLRFGYIENTSDPDYAKAKRDRTVALALWLAVLLATAAVVMLMPETPDPIFPNRDAD
jgi:glucan phosphoethanolaminetransferase (alkaline phosphatase superfamily)